MNILTNVLLLLILVSGCIGLQIFLSRKPTWWYGLVLPAVSLLFSLITVFSMAAYSQHTTQVSVVNESGQVISQNQPLPQEDRPSLGATLGQVIPVFLISNLPTLGLLVIYFACREKFKKRQEIQKMNIQDLE